MLAFDTNLAVFAANRSAPQNAAALEFFGSLTERQDVAVAEYMLVELYLKLRNRAIFPVPFTASEALEWCRGLRENRNWQLIESAPVMEQVWELAGRRDFAFRRIIDARLALTLRYFGVQDFATTNTKDFEGLGFRRVWNPLHEPAGEVAL